jgi:hypothetical protein
MMLEKIDQKIASPAKLDSTKRKYYFTTIFLERPENDGMPLSPLIDEYLSKISDLTAEDFIQCKRELELRSPCYLPQGQLKWIEYLDRTVSRRTSSPV